MKKLFIIIAAVTFTGVSSFAKVFRVGYNGLALTGVDYGSIQEAHDAATPGDTIQVYANVGGGTINKQLVIMGFGYNFDVHPGLQAIGIDAPSNTSLSFGAGSDGSFVSGVSGGFSIGDQSGNHTPVSNITFQRCYGSFYFYQYFQYGPSSNIKILSSVITGGGMQWSGVNDYPVTNLQVFNCYIDYFTLYKTATSAVFVNCVGPAPGYSPYGGNPLRLSDAGVLVRNCIFATSSSSANINTIYENNFFAEAQPAVLPPGTNNRWSQSYDALFNEVPAGDIASSAYYGTAFDENYFTLKPGSPAINGGFDGNNAPTDCGIFGGEAPYVYKPSGVPNIPSIYKLTAPALNASSNPYNVTISVKSNN